MLIIQVVFCEDSGFLRKIAEISAKPTRFFAIGKSTYRLDTIPYNSAVEGRMTLGYHVLSRA